MLLAFARSALVGSFCSSSCKLSCTFKISFMGCMILKRCVFCTEPGRQDLHPVEAAHFHGHLRSISLNSRCSTSLSPVFPSLSGICILLSMSIHLIASSVGSSRFASLESRVQPAGPSPLGTVKSILYHNGETWGEAITKTAPDPASGRRRQAAIPFNSHRLTPYRRIQSILATIFIAGVVLHRIGSNRAIPHGWQPSSPPKGRLSQKKWARE
uniref:Uncharacterized protein n=1 Tax=Arundo donax TaxID=35708 RepID=A0A0A9DCU2_ARUDO